MNYRLLFLLVAIISTLTFVLFSTWRRPSRLLALLLAVTPLAAHPQKWSTFIDNSRAIDWSTAGFTIPNYTSNCATQPSLIANSSTAASANANAIQNALNSCDASHNVVNIPAGTYYVTSIDYGHQSKVVMRGAGASSTTLIMTGNTSNNWITSSISMGGADYSTVTYRSWGATESQPGGSMACNWTGGYAKGSTTITLSGCGSAPPSAGFLLMLDQANDASDNGGVSICDSYSSGSGYPCAQEGPNSNANGRLISGVTHSQVQTVFVNSVTSVGGGSYSVSISPGIYASNIRSGQSPGAWWSGYTQLNGIENMTINLRSAPNGGVSIYGCYQCWVKGAGFQFGPRSDIQTHLSLQSVIRDSYFYSSQTPGTAESYGIEISVATAGLLIENNIFQQLTIPVMFGGGSGTVVGYNFAIDNQFGATNMAPGSGVHNAGSTMNLWEGNIANQIIADDSWGSSAQGTLFRNSLSGWQFGKNQFTYPVGIYATNRAFNVVGNVLGQPGYDTNYESYATSTTGGVSAGDSVNTSIYGLGWTGYNGWGGCETSGTGTRCDPKVRSTLMRWGNWDVVNNGTQWNSTEASPAAVSYVSANFSPTYFSSLAHSLPNSLYYSSTPSWWSSGKPWPPIGPDVSTGNVGTCTGTYAGTQSTAAGKCTGGTLNLAWASHVTSIPALDCYLNTMGGPPDGSGSVLRFDANACYTSSGISSGTGPGSPVGLTALVQ